MRFALDHVVIAVGDLERAVAGYRTLGFTVGIGGRHPGRTSHNALVVFEDGAYLELIAWEPPNPAERWSVEHQRYGDGYMDFALIPEDVPRAVAEAKARGLALAGPNDGGRVRPDGKELRWRTARQATFDLPFLCGDVTPRAWRVPEGEVRKHANGALGVATLTIAVRDLEASLARYDALLGSAAMDGVRPLVLPGTGLRIAVLRLGATALVLATPAMPETITHDSFAGEVARRLAARGEGPCAMAIATAEGRLPQRLDVATTHQALMELA